MIKVSIIVPVYNVERYLRKCLDSLVNQTLKDIEIICVNDGSTDSSLKILEQYAEKYSNIKIIDKVNEGQSEARNIGIECAIGEYLGFVDSDDYVDIDYFEKLYKAAKECNCDIACAGFRRFKFFKGSIKKSYKNFQVIKDINSKAKADKLPAHNYIWNKIYKREIWQKSGFKFEKGRFFEDIALLIKILYYMGDMVTVPDTYYYYRRRNGSTVKLSNTKIKSDHKWAINELYKFAYENNIALEFRNDVQQKILINLFNLPLIKIYRYENATKYKLFGIIPFLSKVIK